MIETKVIPAAEPLRNYVYCYRVSKYDGPQEFSIRVCPNGMPGLVFHCQASGEPAIKSMRIRSKTSNEHVPLLFLHGLITELSTMNFTAGPYVTIQVLLQPHVPRFLFGINATELTNASMSASALGLQPLSDKLQGSASTEARLQLLEEYLVSKISTVTTTDMLIQDSLQFIQANIRDISMPALLEHVPLSARQFDRRFLQAVGVAPQLYMRIRRFNEAMRFIDEQAYERLIDIAVALNYHDQSHFIRDIKLFSGVTPKSISQKVGDFSHDQTVSAYYTHPL